MQGGGAIAGSLVAKHKNGIVTNATLAAFISPAANRARQGWAAVEQLAFVGGSHDAASFFLPALPKGLARIVDVARGCRATEGAANVEMVTVLRGGGRSRLLRSRPCRGGFLLFRQDSRGLPECSIGKIQAGLSGSFKGQGALSLELAYEAQGAAPEQAGAGNIQLFCSSVNQQGFLICAANR